MYLYVYYFLMRYNKGMESGRESSEQESIARKTVGLDELCGGTAFVLILVFLWTVLFLDGVPEAFGGALPPQACRTACLAGWCGGIACFAATRHRRVARPFRRIQAPAALPGVFALALLATGVDLRAIAACGLWALLGLGAAEASRATARFLVRLSAKTLASFLATSLAASAGIGLALAFAPPAAVAAVAFALVPAALLLSGSNRAEAADERPAATDDPSTGQPPFGADGERARKVRPRIALAFALVCHGASFGFAAALGAAVCAALVGPAGAFAPIAAAGGAAWLLRGTATRNGARTLQSIAALMVVAVAPLLLSFDLAGDPEWLAAQSVLLGSAAAFAPIAGALAATRAEKLERAGETPLAGFAADALGLLLGWTACTASLEAGGLRGTPFLIMTVALLAALVWCVVALGRLAGDASDRIDSERLVALACADVAKEHGLSPRERELLPMLAGEADIASIHQALFVSRNTVKTHQRHIYAKLGVHSREELRSLVRAQLR